MCKSLSDNVNIKSCMCKAHTTAITNLDRRCDENGDCGENPVCACDPGYEYNEIEEICKGLVAVAISACNLLLCLLFIA